MRKCFEVKNLPKPPRFTSINFRAQTPGSAASLITGAWSHKLLDPSHPAASIPGQRFPAYRDDILGIRAFPFAILDKPDVNWTEPFSRPLLKWKDTILPGGLTKDGKLSATVARPLIEDHKRVSMSLLTVVTKKKAHKKANVRNEIVKRLKTALSLIIIRGADVRTEQGKSYLVFNDEATKRESDDQIARYTGNGWILPGWTYVCSLNLEAYRLPYPELVKILRRSLPQIYAKGMQLEQTWKSMAVLASRERVIKEVGAKPPLAPARTPRLTTVRPPISSGCETHREIKEAGAKPSLAPARTPRTTTVRPPISSGRETHTNTRKTPVASPVVPVPVEQPPVLARAPSSQSRRQPGQIRSEEPNTYLTSRTPWETEIARIPKMTAAMRELKRQKAVYSLFAKSSLEEQDDEEDGATEMNSEKLWKPRKQEEPENQDIGIEKRSTSKPQHSPVGEDELEDDLGDSGWKLPTELRNTQVPIQSVTDETDPNASDLGLDWFLSLPKGSEAPLPLPSPPTTCTEDYVIKDKNLQIDNFVFDTYRPVDNEDLPALSTFIPPKRDRMNRPLSANGQPSLTDNQALSRQTPRYKPTTPRAHPNEAAPISQSSQPRHPPTNPPPLTRNQSPIPASVSSPYRNLFQTKPLIVPHQKRGTK